MARIRRASFPSAWTFGLATFCLGSLAYAEGPNAETESDDTHVAPAAEDDDAIIERRQQMSQLKGRADALFRARDYVDAVALYDEAYELSPEPRLLYNKGRALQALGRYAEALETLRSFQSHAPAELRASLVGLDELLEELRLRSTAIRVTVNVPGAKVMLGPRLLGHAPLPEAQLVNAGPSRLRVEKDGFFPVERDITLEGGGIADIEVVLESRKRHAKLVVLSKVPGTNVQVDERDLGFAPTEVVLTPGAHTVLARREDYRDARTQVVLEAGQQRTITLDPLQETALHQRWWFWGAVGVVATTAIVTAVVISTRPSRETEGNFSPDVISPPLARF